MDIQNVFYIVAIAFMAVATIISLSILVFLIYSMKKISLVINLLEQNMQKAGDLVNHPDKMASAIGSAVVNTTISKVESLWKREKKA